MDEHSKRAQKERYLRGAKKVRSREEEKELRERARRRRSEERTKGRGRPAEDGEEAGFERMVRAKERPPLELGRARPRAELEPPPAEEQAARALVVAVARGRARVLLDGEERELPLAPELARAQQGALAVGDEALVEELGAGVARVRAVARRRSVLARPDPADPRRELVLAANVDLALIVLAPERGGANLGLVDRVLVALRRGGVLAAVCVNKLDLAAPEERAALERALAPYRALGLEVLFASAASGAGLDALRAAVRGRTCVLVGQSGVGKSSLLNALDPGGARPTRDTRAGDGKGRHTTTSSSLRLLPDGARLIDTPGVRAFGLAPMNAAELAAGFPELAPFAAGCRFRDCTHLHEPACRVRAAVAAGELERARYESYARILAAQ